MGGYDLFEVHVFERGLLSIGFLLLAVLSPTSGHSQQERHRVVVPFVGCKADGQAGPLNAPAKKFKEVDIPGELAPKLAWYESEQGPGVLAPRGWTCFETYGSNGGSLYVSAKPLDPDLLFSREWKGISGPAVQLSVSIGDTSGRFEVAEIIARVFPTHMSFAKRVIAEGLQPASSFPTGPYPSDKLTYKTKELVEYTPPPDRDGLGTESHLIKNSDPIYGVAMLTGKELSLTHLSVRLPSEMRDLVPVIIQQVERSALHAKP